MPALILPSRFNQQPQYPVEIDWGNELTDGLLNCPVPAGNTYIDLVSRALFTRGSGTASPEYVLPNANGYSAQPYAKAYRTATGTNTGWTLPPNSTKVDRIAGTDKYTFLYLAGSIQTASAQTSFGGCLDPISTGKGFYLVFDDNAATGSGRIRSLGSSTVNSTANILPNPLRNQLHFCGAAYNAGAGTIFYANRKLDSIAAANTIDAANATRQLFIANANNGNQSPGAFIALNLVYEGIVSVEKYNELYNNPWQVLKKRPNILYFDVGGGGATTVSCTPGVVAVSGQSATILSQTNIAATAATIAVVGQQATIAQGEVTTRIEATPGTVIVSGQQATLVSRTHIAATAGTVIVSGQQATLVSRTHIAATAGTVVVSGQTATIEQIVAGAVVCTPATVVVSGQQASISQTVKIAATAATVVVSGQQATITQRTGIEATPATVTVTGQQATIVSYTKTSIEATPATVVVSGQQATIVETTITPTLVACTPGLVVVSGGVGNVVSIGGLKGRRRRKYRTTLPEPTEPEIPGTPPIEHGAAFTLASMLQQPSPEPGLLPKARPILRVVGGLATIKEARRVSPEERMATALEQIAGALREDPKAARRMLRQALALLADDDEPETDEEAIVRLLLAQRAA